MSQPDRTQQEEESLRIKTGYVQHTSPLAPNADYQRGRILNVLWELKKAGRAEDTIARVIEQIHPIP